MNNIKSLAVNAVGGYTQIKSALLVHYWKEANDNSTDS
jgi:hypothetical protein